MAGPQIPSQWNEYKFDQNSRNLGMICDGGIMPVRKSNDPYSLDNPHCIRGEDPAFIMEGVYGRQYVRAGSTPSSGLNDRAIRASRLYGVQSNITSQKQYWTPSNPCDVDAQSFPILSVMNDRPSDDQIRAYMIQNFQNWNQNSVGDVYDTLRQEPMLNLFRDIKQMNYTYLNWGAGTSYDGISSTNRQGYYNLNIRGYSDGHYNSTSSYTPRLDWGYIWDNDLTEHYIVGQGYPNNISRYITTYLSALSGWPACEMKWGVKQGYQTRMQCIETYPLHLLQLENWYDGSWTLSSGQTGSDYRHITKWALWCGSRNWWDWEHEQHPGLEEDSLMTIGINALFGAGMQAAASNISGAAPSSGYTDLQLHRLSRVLYTKTYWFAHMLYCNLEDVPPF